MALVEARLEADELMEGKLDWPALLEEALTLPGQISSAYSRFWPYSFNNCLLLRLQGAEGPVASFKRWQELGRHVLKGSKAKVIVRPITVTKKNDDGEVESRFTRFKPVRGAFDYKDTEGEELPPVEIPDWSEPLALTTLEIQRVPFELIDGNIQGYSFERKVAINPVAENPNKTLFHELGHVVLGHTEPEAHAEYVQHRGLKEFQAETTAFLSMKELEQLDDDAASKSRGYVQHWMHAEVPPEAAIRQVFSATDKILRAGRPQPELPA